MFGQPAPKYVIWRYLAPETRIIEMSEHRLDAGYLAGPSDYLEIKRRNHYAIAWFEEPPYQWIDPCPRYMVLNERKCAVGGPARAPGPCRAPSIGRR